MSKDFEDRSKVGQWIFAAKELFKLRKLFKNIDMENLSLEKIRQIWVLLTTVIATLNLTWLPDWIMGLTEVEGTNLLFALLSAGVGLWQFVESRTGKKAAAEAAIESAKGNAPAPLKAERNKLVYALWPFAKAA